MILYKYMSFKLASRNYGILSLTRNPLNPLMWSHYGDDHRGVVMPQNILPSSTIESLMSVGDDYRCFRSHKYDLFKNAFLMKDLAWGYEEEVRVVKNIKSNDRSRYTLLSMKEKGL